MKAAESLLPGTHAITRGTVESIPYRGKRLVRYKSARNDCVIQRQFEESDEAHKFFLECVEKLKKRSLHLNEPSKL